MNTPSIPFAPRAAVFTTAIVLVAGCQSTVVEESVGEDPSALYGASLTFWDSMPCSESQRRTLGATMRTAKQVAETPEFEACILSRVQADYLRCNGDGNPKSNTLEHAVDVLRVTTSDNSNNVHIGCDPTLGPYSGITRGADVQSFDHISREVFSLGPFNTQNPSLFQTLKLSDTIWHETMHTHRYEHDSCGQVASYHMHRNGMPSIVGTCMVLAGLGNRVFASDTANYLGMTAAGTFADSTANTSILGPGRYSEADLGPAGNNRIGGIMAPPGMVVRMCDGPNMTGACSETTALRFGALMDDLTHNLRIRPPNNTVSSLELHPAVLAFRDTYYRGTSQAFTANRATGGPQRYRANSGEFATIGNDSIRSLLIPAGLIVRACPSEGGGSGSGTCSTFQANAPILVAALDRNISFLEVSAAVTLFQHEGFYGQRLTLRDGTYRASRGQLAPIGDNQISSIIVPHGKRVRVCQTEGTGSGGGVCRTLVRSEKLLAADLHDQVSYVEVSSAP